MTTTAERSTFPKVSTWTERAIREWFTRCDRCKKWRLVAHYHEFHGVKDTGWLGTWWRECMTCSFATVADWGVKYYQAFMLSLAEELEAQSES